MSNQAQISKEKFDLNSRTEKFGIAIIYLVQTLKIGPINSPLISQTVRAGTSVGANYMEADAAESKKDFIHKIGICCKEAKETMHWLKMISTANPDSIYQCRTLWKEAHELVLIFSAIMKSRNV